MDATAEELREFIEQAPVGLIQADLQGQARLTTPRAAEMLKPFADFDRVRNVFTALSRVAPELRGLVLAFDHEMGIVARRRRLELPARIGGERVAVEITIEKLSADRLLFSLEDVTALLEKEHEAELRAQMMNSIVENIRGQKVCVLNKRGVVVSWNASGERLNGYSSFEVIGRHISEFIAPASEAVAGDEAVAPPAEDRPQARWEALISAAAEGADARGEFILQRKDGSTFWGETVVSLLRDAAAQASGFLVVTRDVTAERERERELRRLAETDPLTGALNRRAFFEAAHDLIEAQPPVEKSFSLAMLDIDHFKRLNDSYGHAVGDGALRSLVQLCQRSVRQNDLICRFGGEEFLIFLPRADADGAAAFSDRLRRQIGELRLFHEGAPVSFTVSIGVASCLPGEALATVIQRADEALYRAKRDGRDRVFTHDAA